MAALSGTWCALMPAHGSTIGAWLLHLAVIEGKPPRAVKEALRAVEYYHSIFHGDCVHRGGPGLHRRSWQ